MAVRRSTLHIFCGKIGSGKSTLARHIADESGAILLVEDAWMTTLHPAEIKTIEDYVRSTRRLRKALTPVIEELLRRGIDVVLDFQANTPEGRLWFRRLFEQSGADHRLHFLSASDELCLGRLHVRNASRRHEYQVSDDEFALFTSHFVAPTTEEGFVVEVHSQD
jgi:predicted kinase